VGRRSLCHVALGVSSLRGVSQFPSLLASSGFEGGTGHWVLRVREGDAVLAGADLPVVRVSLCPCTGAALSCERRMSGQSSQGSQTDPKPPGKHPVPEARQ